MSTKNKLPFSNQFERGHSFNWAGKWAKGKYYLNDEYVTDFIRYGTCILACKKSHLASDDLEPIIVYKDGVPEDVDSPYWDFVNTAINPDVMVALTQDEYNELIDKGLVRSDVFYFIIEE